MTTEVLVLGIGNILWADEGFGIRALEALAAGWEMAGGVEILDGGTQGIYLLDRVTSCRRLLVFDAVDFGLAPGTLRLVGGSDVPRFMGVKKVSLHQTGFQEVLSAASLLGHEQEDTILVGVQPLDLDSWGGALTPAIAAAIEPAVVVALEQLAAWGFPARPASGGQALLGHGLARSDFERHPA